MFTKTTLSAAAIAAVGFAAPAMAPKSSDIDIDGSKTSLVLEVRMPRVDDDRQSRRHSWVIQLQVGSHIPGDSNADYAEVLAASTIFDVSAIDVTSRERRQEQFG